GVDAAGEAEAVEFAEEAARTFHLLIEVGFGEFVEEGDDGVLAAGDAAGRIAIEGGAFGEIDIGAEMQGAERAGCEQGPSIAELDVDGIIGRGDEEFGLSGAAIFLKLFDGPAAGDNEPRAWFHGHAGLMDSLCGFGDGTGAD